MLTLIGCAAQWQLRPMTLNSISELELGIEELKNRLFNL